MTAQTRPIVVDFALVCIDPETGKPPSYFGSFHQLPAPGPMQLEFPLAALAVLDLLRSGAVAYNPEKRAVIPEGDEPQSQVLAIARSALASQSALKSQLQAILFQKFESTVAPRLGRRHSIWYAVLGELVQAGLVERDNDRRALFATRVTVVDKAAREALLQNVRDSVARQSFVGAREAAIAAVVDVCGLYKLLGRRLNRHELQALRSARRSQALPPGGTAVVDELESLWINSSVMAG